MITNNDSFYKLKLTIMNKQYYYFIALNKTLMFNFATKIIVLKRKSEAVK
jgi:hypothetical protein